MDAQPVQSFLDPSGALAYEERACRTPALDAAVTTPPEAVSGSPEAARSDREHSSVAAQAARLFSDEVDGRVTSFTPTRPDGAVRTAPAKPVRARDVRNLVFEGGGGKGFVYIGALEALEQQQVLQYETDDLGRRRLSGSIRGIGGASAGAITALLVSLGYSSAELRQYLLDPRRSFANCFDPASRRGTLRVGVGTRSKRDSAQEIVLVSSLSGAPLRQAVEGAVRVACAILLSKQSRADVAKKLARPPWKLPWEMLARDWPRYLTYLINDMGLFDGGFVRTEMARLVRERLNSPYPYVPQEDPAHQFTFDDHWRYTGERVKLLLTASNLESGKTVVFSKDDTPDFPVADAVRMSMGIPFVFKPYILEDDRFEGRPPPGVYVDGGLWNNVPFREFDCEGGAPETEATLALRLEHERPVRVRNIRTFVAQYLYYTLGGSGETQVLERYRDRTILLETGELGLIEFSPPREKYEPLVDLAREAVQSYFAASAG